MHALIELQMENDAAVAADPSVDKVTYDFFVSTTPAENVGLMKETYDAIGPWPMEIHYLTDNGATFDDHFDYAFKEMFAQGYERIVSVGGDIPTHAEVRTSSRRSSGSTTSRASASPASCRRRARNAARR